MNALIRSMKTQFAGSAAMQSVVGDRCKFVASLQNIKTFPVVVYNTREVDRSTKDDLREYELVIFVISQDIDELLEIYDVCKTTMDTATTDFQSWFNGSSYPEFYNERDDIYIIDINYRIQQ